MKKILLTTFFLLSGTVLLPAQRLSMQNVNRVYARGGSIIFPYVTQAANPRVLDSLQQFVRRSMVQGYSDVPPSFTLEDIRDKTYSVNPVVADAIGDCPECTNNTRLTLTEQKRMYTLDLSWDEFCCGAHGSYGEVTVYMDRKSGAILCDTAFFRGDYAAAFVRFGEPQIRQAFDIPEGESLYDHGVGWEPGPLPLAANYVFSDSGIRFYYNKYEVSPWALPAPEFLVSWEQAAPFLKPYYLGGYLKTPQASGEKPVFMPEKAVLLKLSGTIAGKQQIKMQLKRLGEQVSGWYYYENRGLPGKRSCWVPPKVRPIP